MPLATHQTRTPVARSGPWLLVAAAALLPFLATLNAGFVADDYFALAAYQHADVSPVRFVSEAVLTMARVPTAFYRPLAFVTVWLETRVWGVSPWPFHLTNLLLHLGVCLLTFALVRRFAHDSTSGTESDASRATLGTASLGRAALAAVVLFAVFPRRVEAVAWVACRPDLLAALLAVAAALLYVRAMAHESRWQAIGAALLWLGSLLSKESAVLLPAALWFAPGPRRRLTPFALAFAGYLALRRTALGVWIGGYGAGAMLPAPLDLVRAARHVAYLLLPPIEAADQHVWAARIAAAIIVCLLVSLGWAVLRCRRDPLVRFGGAWIIATILPVAALPVSLATTFNDRLLYLPGIGMACLLAGLLAHATQRTLRLVTLTVVAPLTVIFITHSWLLAHRWNVAGALSATLIHQLGDAIRERPTPIVIAAAPDSYGGAYMLRTAIPEALRVTGLDSPPVIIVLGHYFVRSIDATPLQVARPDAVTLEVTGLDGRPELLPDAALPPSMQLDTTGAVRDRYGRVSRARVTLPPDSRVLLLRPDRVERVSP